MCASETSTFVPSPTQAIRTPSRPPRRRRIVSTSASAWQGCSTEVSALITGMSAASAHSSSSSCESTRIARTSRYRESTCAVSLSDSPLESCISCGVSVTKPPPSWTIATPKEIRVRVEGWPKKSPSVRPGRRGRRSTFSSSARSRMASISAGTRSVIRSRSRPARETGSGDFTTTALSPRRPPPLRRPVSAARRPGARRCLPAPGRRPARGRRGTACPPERALRRRRWRAAAGR